MKRIAWALGLSAFLNLAAVAANYLAYRLTGSLLIAKTLYGGEIIEEVGPGWILATIYPMTEGPGTESAARTIMRFEPVGVLISFVMTALILFAVFSLVHALRRRKPAGKEDT